MKASEVVSFLTDVIAREGDLKVKALTGFWVRPLTATGERVVICSVGDGEELGKQSGEEAMNERFTEEALKSQDGKQVPVTLETGGPVIAVATLKYDPEEKALTADLGVSPTVLDLFKETPPVDRIKSVVFQPSNHRYGNKMVIALMESGKKDFVFAWYDDELTFKEEELIGLTVAEACLLKQRRDTEYLQN